MSASSLLQHRPVFVALTVGDPSGIGPELVMDLLGDEELADRVRLVVVGPGDLRPSEVPQWEGREAPGGAPLGHRWCESEGTGQVVMGKAQRSCGLAALAALRRGVELARSGEVAALVTAPVCKEALHLAGETVEGQTEYLGRLDGAEQCEMVAMVGDLRVILLTRHMSLKDALAGVKQRAIVERLQLFDETLRREGVTNPRLVVAGLNPHAGEGGLFGSEEHEQIEPAIAEARSLGLDVSGPVSPDAVFLEAARGRWDGVLALYHDQAFIPLKLLSHGRGVTLLAGLSFRRLSPVHGTAFDIAGQGIADATNLKAAVLAAAQGAVASARECIESR